MNKFRAWSVLLLFIFSILGSGCSSSQVFVRATAEELEAVRALRKSIAIIPYTEEGTQITGISPLLNEKLADYLSYNFKIIDPMSVQQALDSKKPSLNDWAQLVEIGKTLGADYIMVGNATVNITGPKIRYTLPEFKNKEFYAKVWTETEGRTDLSIKMISTKNGAVVYSDDYWGTHLDRSDTVKFNNLLQYNKAIDATKMTKEVMRGAEVLSSLKGKHLDLVEKSMDPALNLLRKNLRNYLVQYGEVLKVISDKEILVNLGSAYGLKPGDNLSVWRESESIKDPNTGRVIIPKERVGVVIIDRVTSGLSCVAKGKPKEIKAMQIGNKVYMH